MGRNGWTGSWALVCRPGKRPIRRQAQLNFSLMLRLMVQRREIFDAVLMVRGSAISAAVGQETVHHVPITVRRSATTVAIASRLTVSRALQPKNGVKRRTIQAWHCR